MNDETALVVRGRVIDSRDEDMTALEADVKRLRRELTMANGEIARAKEEAAGAVRALRQQLAPLYRALQSVFGELDKIGAREDGAVPESGRSARELALWADWKSKLPSACGKVIDALLLHPELNVRQLKVACHLGENSVYQATSRLGQAGLVNKNSGRFSLKTL